MAKELSPSERAFIASAVRSAIDLVFAHWEGAPHSDLDERYRQLLDATVSRGSRRHFSLEMAAFLARLQNGHTLYQDPLGWKPDSGSLGFSAAHPGGEWIVARSWLPGLRAGLVLQSINGETVEDLYSELKRYVPASSDRARRMRFSGHPHLFQRTLRVAADGITLTHKRVPGRHEPAPLKVGGRWLRRGQLAYAKIPSFGDPINEQRALQFARNFQRAPALIVDVRGNRGGATPGRLIAALMDRPWRSWTESTVLRIGVARANVHLLEMAEKQQGAGLFLDPEKLAPLASYRDWDSAHMLFPPTPVPAEPGAYAGRLFLLMDERCGSACEDFLVPFKDNRRATLIGTTSEGSTGQPYVLDLTDGIRAYIGAKRAYFPDGSPFEGIGIRPDVELATTRDDLLQGRDPVLDTAVDQALSLRTGKEG